MDQKTSRHLSMGLDPVRRHTGDCFARQVAYIGRIDQWDPRTGKLHDFSGREEVEYRFKHGWSGDVDELVAAVAFSERRSKAVEGRVAKLALPHELSPAAKKRVTQNCARYFVARYGVAVVAGIHRPPIHGDPHNWHTHLLITSRKVEDGMRLGAKTRVLDTLRTGRAEYEAFREWWCAQLNRALKQEGHEASVEHKSFARLGLDTEPQRYRGVRVTAAIRRKNNIPAQSSPASPQFMEQSQIAPHQEVLPTAPALDPTDEQPKPATPPKLRPLVAPRRTNQHQLGLQL